MPTFTTPPTVDLLKRLAPNNSLKQSLSKAVRLWVILQSLYGDEVAHSVPDKFTYNDWQQDFFSHSHSFGRDTMPSDHDPECNCAKSIDYWLFEYGNNDRGTWSQAFCDTFNINQTELLVLLDKIDRPFAITGHSLKSDFEMLVNAQCIQFQIKPNDKPDKNRYAKVAVLPKILSETTNVENPFISAAEFIQTDLSEFVDALAQPIRSVQRFFLHTEYIVPNRLSNQVNDYQAQLKECWDRPEVPPINLKYCSAREFQDEFDWLVYPVCVFYYQRAPYLFAYGHQRGHQALEWYDFRLDHITRLEVLDWQHPDLGPNLLARQHNPPTPDEIHQEMSDVWGFEFYRPSECMILRFNRYFYANYIEPTERAALFTTMTHTEVSKLISRIEDIKQRQALQSVLEDRNNTDTYCRINFRSGDRNILMRLRAWSPNVEVILPYTLRQQIAQETLEMHKMYH